MTRFALREMAALIFFGYIHAETFRGVIESGSLLRLIENHCDEAECNDECESGLHPVRSFAPESQSDLHEDLQQLYNNSSLERAGP